MKELLQQSAAYNVWANQQLVEAVLRLPEDLQTKETPSSFPGLHRTILHLWDAGSIWWQRLKLQEVVIPPSLHFNGITRDAANGLVHQDKLWESWVNQATETALQHVFAYQNSKKEHFKQPMYQALYHLFNHSTYHRGQIVTMFHQLGVTKIPNTDFIGWARNTTKRHPQTP
ncbi:MAG TPA: DinB family protein [Chitinophagaceae bacterium]|jgi:uncharacterized damage-inducible protein DinB